MILNWKRVGQLLNDWTRKAIFQADKNSGAGVMMVQEEVNGPTDMKIYSSGSRGETNGPKQWLSVQVPLSGWHESF